MPKHYEILKTHGIKLPSRAPRIPHNPEFAQEQLDKLRLLQEHLQGPPTSEDAEGVAWAISLWEAVLQDLGENPPKKWEKDWLPVPVLMARRGIKDPRNLRTKSVPAEEGFANGRKITALLRDIKEGEVKVNPKKRKLIMRMLKTWTTASFNYGRENTTP